MASRLRTAPFKGYPMSSILLSVLLACGSSEPAPVEAPEPAATEGAAAKGVEAAPAEEAPAPVRVNLNTATKEELGDIPGITPRLIHEFEEYRPYVSIRQFRKEIGKYVDEATVASFEPYVYVPVSPNESDAATLQQLGLSEEAAQAVIAGRPYDDHAAFVGAVAEHLSEDQIAATKTMLAGK